jgi:hypothetical protein
LEGIGCQKQFNAGATDSNERRRAMNIVKNLGMLLLAIYLIVVGLIGLFGMSLGQLSILVPILAIVAGVVILIGK